MRVHVSAHGSDRPSPIDTSEGKGARDEALQERVRRERLRVADQQLQPATAAIRQGKEIRAAALRRTDRHPPCTRDRHVGAPVIREEANLPQPAPGRTEQRLKPNRHACIDAQASARCTRAMRICMGEAFGWGWHHTLGIRPHSRVNNHLLLAPCPRLSAVTAVARDTSKGQTRGHALESVDGADLERWPVCPKPLAKLAHLIATSCCHSSKPLCSAAQARTGTI